MAYNCTAYHHDRCFKICELGKKNGLVSASQPGADTMTVLIQPGRTLLSYHIIIFSRGIEVFEVFLVETHFFDFPESRITCLFFDFQRLNKVEELRAKFEVP